MLKTVTCKVCFHQCQLANGQRGFCGARVSNGDAVVADNFGKVTSLALDPIEKKPLLRFHPGSKILSVGSYGCNLKCPFCQNHEISQSYGELPHRRYSPKDLVQLAKSLAQTEGNIGIAFTYNEPLVGYEYVLETAKRAKAAGLTTVLVSNGTAQPWVLAELLAYMDAMNIDLKAFTEEGYRRLGGDLESVKKWIAMAHTACHVEVTSLIVPGLNDALEEMEQQAAWLASLDSEMPLHITRFFPRYQQLDTPPTDIWKMERLAEIAKKHLAHVFLGNI